MSDNWLTLLMVPALAVAPLHLMQSLHGTGADIIVDPLAGIAEKDARVGRLTALCDPSTLPSGKSRRIVVLPAASLFDLPPLARFLCGKVGVIRLDSADPARAILRALRIEAWLLGAGGAERTLPIPAQAAFRPQIEPHRFKTMLYEIQIGRTMLDAVLTGLAPELVIFDGGRLPDLNKLGLPSLADCPREPLEALIADPKPLTDLMREDRIDCPGVDLPPLPALRIDNSAPLAGFVCGRNIAPYLPVIAEKFMREDVPLIYIDNGSDDGSAELAGDLIGKGITALHHLPYDGAFSVEAQLRMKQRLIAEYAPRWVLNIDADEIIEHREPGRGLLDLAVEAEGSGYNAINFNEFVFLPLPDQDFSGRDYASEMRRYYLFEPMPFRLLRMWKNGVGLSNLGSAGHRLSGPLKVAPVSHNLRHYIALSQKAARDKYVGRVFAADELARKWHGNRVGITASDIALPDENNNKINTIEGDNLKNLDRGQPLSQHWWQWRRAP